MANHATTAPDAHPPVPSLEQRNNPAVVRGGAV